VTTTTSQLHLDGVPPASLSPRRLRERQRTLMVYVRFYNDQRGAFPTSEGFLYYADARGALRRLERIGLVRRDHEGEWWAT
jgi:hypothetical protein